MMVNCMTWHKAERLGTLNAYKEFLYKSRRSKVARFRVDSLRYLLALQENTMEKYKFLLRICYTNTYKRKVEYKLDSLYWRGLVSINDEFVSRKRFDRAKMNYRRYLKRDRRVFPFHKYAQDSLDAVTYYGVLREVENCDFINFGDPYFDLYCEYNAYEKYLQGDTNGKYTMEIQSKFEKAACLLATRQETDDSLKSFIRRFPNSKYLEDVRDELFKRSEFYKLLDTLGFWEDQANKELKGAIDDLRSEFDCTKRRGAKEIKKIDPKYARQVILVLLENVLSKETCTYIVIVSTGKDSQGCFQCSRRRKRDRISDMVEECIRNLVLVSDSEIIDKLERITAMGTPKEKRNAKRVLQVIKKK